MINKLKNKKQDSKFANPLLPSLQSNIDLIKDALGSPTDLVVRKFTVGHKDHPCAILFIDGLTDKDFLSDQIIKHLQRASNQIEKQTLTDGEELLQFLCEEIISSDDGNKADNFDDVIIPLLAGEAILLLDNTLTAGVLSTKQYVGRLVSEPITESLIRGPRDGFTESIRLNTALLRTRLRNASLRMKPYKVGRRNQKDLLLAYVDDLVQPGLVEEADRRLQTIDIDDAPESGYIEEWIEDSFMSPFPQFTNTERPDRTVAALMRGQIVVLLDGTPFVLIAPITVLDTLQSPEDYYERWLIGSLLRILRYAAMLITIFLPAIYIALVSFHQGMIPSTLAFSLAGTREGVPFPSVLEAFLMEGTMEMLREAGVRLPKPIGQTIGIVGGLVIGEAAVSAGIVSPIMVIIVAITAVASFSLPYYGLAISFRVLRFGAMLSAAVFGFLGIVLFYIVMNIHLTNLKSFGIPYSAPLSPSIYGDWRDTFIRAPITMLSNRPKHLKPKDLKRLNKKNKGSKRK